MVITTTENPRRFHAHTSTGERVGYCDSVGSFARLSVAVSGRTFEIYVGARKVGAASSKAGADALVSAIDSRNARRRAESASRMTPERRAELDAIIASA